MSTIEDAIWYAINKHNQSIKNTGYGDAGRMMKSIMESIEQEYSLREERLIEKLERKFEVLMPEKRAEELADRLSAYDDERYCSLCGADPIMQRNMIFKALSELKGGNE